MFNSWSYVVSVSKITLLTGKKKNPVKEILSYETMTLKLIIISGNHAGFNDL